MKIGSLCRLNTINIKLQIGLEFALFYRITFKYYWVNTTKYYWADINIIIKSY